MEIPIKCQKPLHLQLLPVTVPVLMLPRRPLRAKSRRGIAQSRQMFCPSRDINLDPYPRASVVLRIVRRKHPGRAEVLDQDSRRDLARECSKLPCVDVVYIMKRTNRLSKQVSVRPMTSATFSILPTKRFTNPGSRGLVWPPIHDSIHSWAAYDLPKVRNIVKNCDGMWDISDYQAVEV
jgi:hypothetical protein